MESNIGKLFEHIVARFYENDLSTYSEDRVFEKNKFLPPTKPPWVQ